MELRERQGTIFLSKRHCTDKLARCDAVPKRLGNAYVPPLVEREPGIGSTRKNEIVFFSIL